MPLLSTEYFATGHLSSWPPRVTDYCWRLTPLEPKAVNKSCIWFQIQIGRRVGARSSLCKSRMSWKNSAHQLQHRHFTISSYLTILLHILKHHNTSTRVLSKPAYHRICSPASNFRWYSSVSKASTKSWTGFGCGASKTPQKSLNWQVLDQAPNAAWSKCLTSFCWKVERKELRRVREETGFVTKTPTETLLQTLVARREAHTRHPDAHHGREVIPCGDKVFCPKLAVNICSTKRNQVIDWANCTDSALQKGQRNVGWHLGGAGHSANASNCSNTSTVAEITFRNSKSMTEKK